jgi:hypothetical protein
VVNTDWLPTQEDSDPSNKENSNSGNLGIQDQNFSGNLKGTAATPSLEEKDLVKANIFQALEIASYQDKRVS